MRDQPMTTAPADLHTLVSKSVRELEAGWADASDVDYASSDDSLK